MRSIIIVEEDPEVRQMMLSCVEDLGHTCLEFHSIHDAAEAIGSGLTVDLAICSLELKEITDSRQGLIAGMMMTKGRCQLMVSASLSQLAELSSMISVCPEVSVIARPIHARSLKESIAFSLLWRDVTTLPATECQSIEDLELQQVLGD